MFGLIYGAIILVAGILLMTLFSDKAVEHSVILASALGISPLMIGFTLVSIGTDLPEIVNSIVSCALGHGDINAGDSIGSVLTQLTLIFEVLTFFGTSFRVKRKEIAEASIREKKEISRCYFLIVHRLKIRMPTADPVNHISRIAEKVGISGGSQGLAVKILREAKRKRIIIGKDPLEIAATVLYIACYDPDGYCRRSRRNRGNHKEPEERSNGKTRFRGGSLIERRL